MKERGRDWLVKRRTADRPLGVYANREQAVARAAQVAERNQGRFRVLNLAGHVLLEQDYSQ